jgi:hypothetical protein
MQVELKAAFACVVMLLASVAHAQNPPKYISIENGTTYALSPGTYALQARIAVRAEPKVNLNDLEVSVVDAIGDGKHAPVLVKCITASKEFNIAGAPAIVLTVNCEHQRPDDYDVTLGVTKKTAPAAARGAPSEQAGPDNRSESEEVQKVALKLTRPVPTLRAIAAQSVERIIRWPDVTLSQAPSGLILTETSNRTLPISFTAKQVDNATIDGHAVPGKLEFASAKTDRDGHAELQLTMPERFPLGKAKTTIEIRSSDLAAPIYVVYDVTTKLHGAYVFAAILVGLMLGFVTRTLLKAAIEKGTAKIAALDLIDKMRTAKQRWGESKFRSTVTPLIAGLSEKLTLRDAVALKEAVTKIDSEFTVAFTDLQQRVTTILGSIEAAVALTSSATEFPRAIADALTTAVTELSSARLKVVQGEVDAGRAAAENASTAMGLAVENEAATWRTALQSSLSALDALAPLPPAIRSILPTTLTAIRDQIARMPAASRTPNVASILDAVHAIQFVARHDLVQRVLMPLTTEAEQAISTLRDAGASAPTVETARAVLSRAIQADVDTTLVEPATAAAELLHALQKDLGAAAAAATVNVSAELAAGTYVDAAAKIANASRMAAGGPAAQRQATAGISAPLSFVPPLMLRARLMPTLALAQQEPVQLARARTFREIAAAKGVQFVIAATGIAIIGLLTLLPTFDGTWRGVVAAFFWGYAGDITIDALTDAAKRVK